MQRRVSEEIASLLEEAERNGSCLAATSRRLRRDLVRRVQTGELVSPLPHLYVRADLWRRLSLTERTRRLIAGLSRLHPSWTFCGTSAAVMHGLCLSEAVQRPIEVAAASRTQRHPTGDVARRYVSGDRPTLAAGVPVTSIERTVFDCARRLGLREGLAVADSALRLGALDRERLAAYVREMGPHHHGYRTALLVAALADPRPENGKESIARATMYELGFALPDLQVPFADPMDPSRVFRVDFLWTLPDGTVIIGELDGGEKYRDPVMSGGSPLVALRGERRRESRLTIDRPKIVRFSPDEVDDVAFLNRLLETFGVPRDHEPLIQIPEELPYSETVPLEAYGLP